MIRAKVEYIPNRTTDSIPYAVRHKKGWFGSWEFNGWYPTLESAKAVADGIVNNPVYETRSKR